MRILSIRRHCRSEDSRSDFRNIVSRAREISDQLLDGRHVMPCHVPATSTSSRRRSLYRKRPPTIAANLDLSKPGEAWAEDYLRRASTGTEAFWRPLAIRRDDAALLVAVQWLDGEPAKDRYSVVMLSLTERALS